MHTKPLTYVTDALLELKELKIKKHDKLRKYINTNSEVGQISTALNSLSDSLYKNSVHAQIHLQIQR